MIVRPLIAACCLVLAGCSSTIPKIQVAPPAPAPAQTVTQIRSDECAQSLIAAEADGRGDSIQRFVIGLERRLHPHDWVQPVRIAGAGRVWEVNFSLQPANSEGKPEWSPGRFDRILPADAFKLEGYDQIVAGPGSGAALVLATDKPLRARSYSPRNGDYVPGTAVLEFDRTPSPAAATRVHLRIYNPHHQRTALVAGRTRPLCYNITAAVEAHLANPYIAKSGLTGLLRPGDRSKDFGLFAVTAYDPKKIPVVFVHGLESDASIWRNAVNEIYASRDLTARYQPLLFMYPTGGGVPNSAAKFRHCLQLYRDTWDPDHNDPGMNRMILVGHSLGGLLTRFQVINSGDDLERAFLSKPLAQVKGVSPETRARFQEAVHFVVQPYVKRAVFVATPHKGSAVAQISIVKLFTKLIKLPLQMTQMAASLLTTDPSVLNPALLGFNQLGLRSVDMLAPNHPYFAAINKTPPLVPFHSIIGDRGKGNTPNSSDGVVPYWSSHVDGALSELIVPYGHSCTAKPETVHEITRILRLHAGLSTKESNPRNR